MKVNLGCGEFYAKGWVNVDRTNEDGGPRPDVIASGEDLPFEDHTVDRLYAGHVLEHISIDQVPIVLGEIRRVLQKDGTLMVVGPDLDRALESYPEVVDDIRYGGCRWEGDEHLWESRESTMVGILESDGWGVTVIPIQDVDTDIWPLTSKIGWQFAVEATPTTKSTLSPTK